MGRLHKADGVRFPVHVPNEKEALASFLFYVDENILVIDVNLILGTRDVFLDVIFSLMSKSCDLRVNC